MKMTNNIDQTLLEYCRENLLEPWQLSISDWTQVYKLAGMSDEEIAKYKKQLKEEEKKYPGALDDPLDKYRN